MDSSRAQFTFHQCLGKGGFGEVYLATLRRSGGLKQRVAVKVLKEGLPNEGEAVRRLRDEGAMLATLNHPAILRVHDLCRVSGRIALVTEYIEGIDLARCAKPRRLLPPKVVVSAIGEVASALDSALNTISPETGRPLHMIHRDLKPENIRISVHGQVKLLDFGIARTTEMIRHAQTQAGDLPFTPGYAAPECFVSGRQGPESDVYALGVTLYRLLTGRRLFEGMDLAAQVQVSVRPDRYGPWLEERLAKIPDEEGLRDLVENLLAYEASDRRTAALVHDACEEVVDNLKGHSLTRWARSATFPPPRNIEGATLTGRTLSDDGVSTDVSAGPVPTGEFELPNIPREPSPPAAARVSPQASQGAAPARQSPSAPPRRGGPVPSLPPSTSQRRGGAATSKATAPPPPPVPMALRSGSVAVNRGPSASQDSPLAAASQTIVAPSDLDDTPLAASIQPSKETVPLSGSFLSRTLADEGLPEPPAGDGGSRWLFIGAALGAALLVLALGAGAVVLMLYLVS